MFGAALAGFLLGGSLIIAIGAQNAFVIRQGILNQYVFWVCLFCFLSDAILIWSGIYGLAAVLAAAPKLLALLRYGGTAFLIWYGIKAVRRALSPEAIKESDRNTQSLASALSVCAAFTWLNPHVYIDTVVLLGSIANARAFGDRAPFAFGASFASFVWFFAIGYGAKALRGPLSQPKVWRVINLTIAAILFWIAIKLLLGS